MSDRLKIAVQKSGRLTEKSLELLKECSIEIKSGKRQLIAPSTNFPVDLLYLRDDDIPQYVADGVADIGILGENVLIESKKEVEVIRKLGFSKCRLSLAIPRAETYEGIQYFQNKRIATSYPNLIRDFLEQQNIQSEIHEISGSVEIAPNIGLADAICDIVSTGSTLVSNGLKEVATVMQSEAVMIASPQLSATKKAILEKLIFRLQAVSTAKRNKYILLNAPNSSLDAICQLLPGMKSPTVLPLQKEDWSSLHSVVNEDIFWDVIDQLKTLGAEGILIAPIEKMIL